MEEMNTSADASMAQGVQTLQATQTGIGNSNKLDTKKTTQSVENDIRILLLLLLPILLLLLLLLVLLLLLLLLAHLGRVKL